MSRNTWPPAFNCSDRGIYTYDIQHPPLGRLAMAIGPYLDGARSYGEPGPSGEQEGRDLLYRHRNYNKILTLARVGMLPFLILLLLATWAWTRELFGYSQATLAVALLIATPPLLGHAGVAALDVPSAATCIFAMYLGMRWFQKPTWLRALAVGAASGLAIGTKLSAIPFLGLVAIVWTVLRSLHSRQLVAGQNNKPHKIQRKKSIAKNNLAKNTPRRFASQSSLRFRLSCLATAFISGISRTRRMRPTKPSTF